MKNKKTSLLSMGVLGQEQECVHRCVSVFLCAWLCANECIHESVYEPVCAFMNVHHMCADVCPLMCVLVCTHMYIVMCVHMCVLIRVCGREGGKALQSPFMLTNSSEAILFPGARGQLSF